MQYNNKIKTKEELDCILNDIDATIPYSENTRILKKTILIQDKILPNRLAIQPMEGCDATTDGVPGDLTNRRYLRFAKSGAGLIWCEATAIVPEGKANPRQMFICKKNIDQLKNFVSNIKNTCIKTNGFEPIVICQLTHSGRYSKPNGKPEPLIAYHNPIFEKDNAIDDSAILSDDYLKSLEEKYAVAAKMANEIGFDGADIKCCHRYLLSELCSAYERKGNYGGSFENRTRLFLNAIRYSKNNTNKDFIITTRLNVYDGFPYPYGFGVAKDSDAPDMTEPIQLVKKLLKENIEMINISIGNPYKNPHVNRPFDLGPYELPENPVKSVARMFDCTKKIKEACPEIKIVSSSHTYLKKLAPQLAAGYIEQNVSDVAGFGREAFAYPQFANDILNGKFDDSKCCITCSKCTSLMRAGSVTGCVIRDSEIYLPYYKKYVKDKRSIL